MSSQYYNRGKSRPSGSQELVPVPYTEADRYGLRRQNSKDIPTPNSSGYIHGDSESSSDYANRRTAVLERDGSGESLRQADINHGSSASTCVSEPKQAARRGKPIEELSLSDLHRNQSQGYSQRSLTITDQSKETAKHRALVAAAMLTVKEGWDHDITLEYNSVYTTAIAMPQFARSAGWPPELTTLAIRSYFFLAMNVFVQCFLVQLLMTEEIVMDAFSGEMNLCDFGGAEGCPHVDGCVGPGGTRITPPRLYPFPAWNTRKYLKDALLQVFPERVKEIHAHVDPGEYGVKSTHVRFLCIFIFVMSSIWEFYEGMCHIAMLYCLPSSDESWMDYEGDDVFFKTAGMPRHWKVITMVVVVIPKLILWVFTLRTGCTFIMDTSDIDDTVVNATALGFILTIDEMMFATVLAPKARHMMERLRGFSLRSGQKDCRVLGTEEDTNELIERSGVLKWRFSAMFPWRLSVCVVLATLLVAEYYWRKCQRGADGAQVSHPLHLPKSREVGFLNALLPYIFPVPVEDDVYWTMPTEHDSGISDM